LPAIVHVCQQTHAGDKRERQVRATETAEGVNYMSDPRSRSRRLDIWTVELVIKWQNTTQLNRNSLF